MYRRVGPISTSGWPDACNRDAMRRHLYSDLGGEAALSQAEKLLVDRATAAELLLRMVGDRVLVLG